MLTDPRYQAIAAAYVRALADRDPTGVAVTDLLPAIHAAVPEASTQEIVAAVQLCFQTKRRMDSPLLPIPPLRPVDETELAACDDPEPAA
jgi:hypothetical protein